MSKAETHDIETVVIKTGRNGNSYHKHDPHERGRPACGVNGRDADSWKEWGIEKADVWRDPCQNPECYGDGVNGTSDDDDEASWPV